MHCTNCSHRGRPTRAPTLSVSWALFVDFVFFVYISCVLPLSLSLVQVAISVGNSTSIDGTVYVAHDASADEMRNAIAVAADASLDGYIGDLLVSRESNGAQGLQTYRYGVSLFLLLYLCPIWPGVCSPSALQWSTVGLHRRKYVYLVFSLKYFVAQLDRNYAPLTTLYIRQSRTDGQLLSWSLQETFPAYP